MNWNERRERFRALMAGNRCVHTGSVYDAISARIAEDLGFEVGIFSGSIGSMAVLGAPDLVVMTLTEFASQANRICRAGNLCLLVDADHGYGNALNVRRTVEELETAGICAMSIGFSLARCCASVRCIVLGRAQTNSSSVMPSSANPSLRIVSTCSGQGSIRVTSNPL